MSCYPVVASYIDAYQFGFQCPFCSSEHIHGNCNDYLTKCVTKNNQSIKQRLNYTH